MPYPALTHAPLLLSVSCLVVIYSLARRLCRLNRLPLPPGPKRLPLLGNIFDLPAERQWEAYQKWSREYDSDIIHLDIMGTSIIVLSSLEATQELFERRSSIYSDRPHLTMVVDLMGWDWSIGLMQYGNPWRAHRKMMQHSFSSSNVHQFQHQETAAVHQFLRRVLEEPNDIMAHFRQMTGGLMMDLAYGVKVRKTGDPYIQMVTEAMHGLAVATAPGAFLVDTIPALKHVPSWFPGASFQRQAAAWRKVTRGVLEEPFAETQRNIVQGTGSECFVSLSLQNVNAKCGDLGPSQPGSDIRRLNSESVIRNTAANIYAGGADTTVAALGYFVFGILSNPKAQAMAQAELDAVLGPGMLPTFEDRRAGTLPYVTALVKEVLRWKNVTPMGVPHYVKVEDEYRGFRIPANSIVIGNVWALLHDPEMYPEPHSFNPERFLDDGKLNPNVRDPESAFGFGRRVCPGKHLASATLWLTIACMLATFTIEKAVDENGDVETTFDEFPGIVSTPLPFKCIITPRSPQIQRTLQLAQT